MKTYYIIAMCTLIFCSCAYKEKTNISMDEIEKRITNEIKLDNPVVTEIKDNSEAAERYGIPLDKIDDGFVYTNEESGKSADEIVVVKVSDKKHIGDVEKALEGEITGLATAWDGVDSAEFEKVQKHILRSKGSYVLLSINGDNKKVEEIFNDLLE